MTQADIPVQPGETPVTAALRTLAGIMGWAVMHTTDGGHAETSYHYVGRAVDLAARSGAGVDTSELLTINEAVVQVLPLPMISELIYAGPGNVCVKNGRVVSGAQVYGADVLALHHNHVHLAVAADFRYSGGTPLPADDPNRPNVTAPIVGGFAAHDPATGDVKGYALIGADGGIFIFGRGIPMLGNVEFVKPDDRAWLPKT